MSWKTWRYMDELDYRYKWVSEQGFIRNYMRVAEFNCGNGRFKDYLPSTTTYIANDLYLRDEQKSDKCYKQISDSEFYEYLTQNYHEYDFDILALFGVGGYEITKEPLESSTITNNFVSAVNKLKPKIVVIESVEKFKAILNTVVEKTNYDVRNIKESNSGDWLKNRVLMVLERKIERQTKLK